MKTQYAVIDQAGFIENILLNKPKNYGPLRYVVECDFGSFNRLKGMKERGEDLKNVRYVIDNDVLYLPDIYDIIVADRKRKELEQKLDDIVDCVNDSYPYSTGYMNKFRSLTLEEKVELTFELAFRALVRLKRKVDVKEEDY